MWLRARDVIAGEDAVKVGGIKYLPRLDSQSDNEYLGYKSRACFFNATSRTRDGFLGLLFRRDPEVKLPDRHAGVGGALRVFTDDVDLMGTSLFTFCKGVTGEVLSVGRSGTLVDWQSDGESRAYVVRYAAEDILNWQTARINGRNVVTMVSLREFVERPDDADPFAVKITETVRVLKLEVLPDGGTRYVVEVWQRLPSGNRGGIGGSLWSGFFGQKPSQPKTEWTLVETRVPLRLGKPLPLIPFVFHGPRNALPDVDKMPLADIVYVNLDHYRLDADYKHGLHFTALPTAWVSGFDKDSELRIGSSTAWVAEAPGAVAGFLEFKGHGLSTFENAQNRDERLMAVLGSRMAVHSAVEAALRKLELIDYLPDSEGKPTIKVFQGRRVIIDDSIPVRAGTTSGYVYTSYLFGPGCFARGNASLNEPVEGGHGTKAVEWQRSALDSDTNFINRRRYLLHPRGVKFTSSSLAGVSPTNAELETVANWTRVFEAKNVRMVAIDHNI